MSPSACSRYLTGFACLVAVGCGSSSSGGASGGGGGSGGNCTGWCCPEQNTGSLEPEVLVQEQHDPCGLALDGSTLFWTRLDGKVMRSDVSGGSVQELFDGADFLSCSLAVTPTHVYFSEQEAGRVLRVPRDGGPAEELAKGQGQPGAFVLGDGVVYWLDHGASAVMSLPVDGAGPPQVLAAFPKKAGGLAVDATHVYTIVGDFKDGRALHRVPVAGGPAEKLTETHGSGDIVVDSTQVYWAEANLPGRVARAPIAGGAAEAVQVNEGLPVAVALDESSVYFSEGNGISAQYRVWRAPKSGGEPELLVNGQCGPYGLAMDATRLYWTNQYSGTIGSAVK
ncbi:MAG: hypothetical protein IT377_23645 [Polyangiaceae bacterium]|nr:hypothetical protein [Polyangiaceae bacterium]